MEGGELELLDFIPKRHHSTKQSTTLSVHFECSSEKTATTKEVELPPGLPSVQQIKEYFEEKYDIPVCLQTLRRSSVVLKQDTPVASLCFRDGDELHVSYYAKAECQEMRRVMRWLEAFVNCVVHGGEFPQDLNKEERVLDNVGFELFMPWETPVKLANKKVFVSNGGLNLTIQLHNYLLSHQWDQLPGLLKAIENEVLLVLWHLCETLPFRHAILNGGCLRSSIMSLLRVPILPNQPIIDTSATDFQEFYNSILSETIQRALGVISRYVIIIMYGHQCLHIVRGHYSTSSLLSLFLCRGRRHTVVRLFVCQSLCRGRSYGGIL